MRLCGNMLRKKMFRDIKLNLSQFITIFLMVFIGVLVYCGIESYMTGMKKTADKFYKENNLQDLNIIGTNFSETDLKNIKKINHVKNAERNLLSLFTVVAWFFFPVLDTFLFSYQSRYR